MTGTFRAAAIGLAVAVGLTGCGSGDGETVAVADAPVRPLLAEPVALRIPSLGVNTALEKLARTESGELETPDDPQRAGWFVGGAIPGEIGPAVIAGHVDSRVGPAVFYRLSRLAAGDEILVDAANGATVTFRVQAVERYPKDGFPTDAVYGGTPERALRLITCGGVFDRERRSYEENVVVFATASPTAAS